MISGQSQRASIERLRFISLRQMMEEYLGEKRGKEPRDVEGIQLVENDLKTLDGLIALREKAVSFYSRNPSSNISFKDAVRKEQKRIEAKEYYSQPEIKAREKKKYGQPEAKDKRKQYDKIRRSSLAYKQMEKIKSKKPEVVQKRRKLESERLKIPKVHAKRLDSYKRFHSTDDYRKKNRERESGRRQDPDKRPRILELQRGYSAKRHERERAEKNISRYFQNWHPGRLDEAQERLAQSINPPLVAQKRVEEKERKRREARITYLEEYKTRPGIREHEKKYFHDYRLTPEFKAKLDKKKEERELYWAIRGYFKKLHRVRRI